MDSLPIISEVTFYPCPPSEKGFLGVSSLLFDGKLSLNSISVYVNSTGGHRLLFPNTILKNGREVNYFYPISRQVYDVMLGAIEQKIEEVQEKANGAKYHEKRTF